MRDGTKTVMLTPMLRYVMADAFIFTLNERRKLKIVQEDLYIVEITLNANISMN